MRVIPLHPLRIAGQLACILFTAGAQDVLAFSAAKGLLTQSMGVFQLTGKTNPSLREVNGGRLCVNGFGKTPPGYYFKGQIGLEQCAAIAQEQPSSLGFRWGRIGFDYGVYSSYAHALGGNQSDPVDLSLLFPDADDFVCAVYVGFDTLGQPYSFVKSNLSSQFSKPKLKDGPASSVCFQRWTMTEFFKPFVSELWFCYMPKAMVEHCDKQSTEFYMQGKLFIVVFCFFLAILGYIMADLPEFEAPLVWFTRLLLNLELGLLSCGLLLEKWYDTENASYFILAYVLDVAGGVLLFCPYWIMERISEDSPFNTAYLLLLAFSPCFLMEFMSYWSHFILLVGHQPLLIGFVAFSTSALFMRYYAHLKAHWEASKVDIERRDSSDDIDKASYASVPTDEPEPPECCNADRTFSMFSNKFPRSCV